MVSLHIGIFAWVVAGALALQQTGRTPPVPDGQDLARNRSQILSADFPFLAGEQDKAAVDAVDAWLVVHFSLYVRNLENLNMYTGLLNTVKEGLEDEGAVVRIAGTPDVESMLHSIHAAVAQGRRPLVFTVAHDWVGDRSAVFAQLRQAKHAGAYLVQYNSEPAEMELNDKGNLAHLDEMLDWAADMEADEIWDYTMAHLPHYPQRDHRPIIRYIPPGYSRYMDTGVDLESSPMQTQAMAYLGVFGKKTCSGEYQRMLGTRLYHETHVWTLDALQHFTEKYPLQLNMHRHQSCLPREKWEDEYQHFESFRMSTVLPNKACVISPPSALPEMQLWKSFVNFAEVEDTERAMESFFSSPQKLAECRQRSYDAFKRDFNGQVLLRKSGFFSVWHVPYGKTRSPATHSA